jgi:chromosome segregation ATPase
MLRDSFDLHRQASQTLLELHTPTSPTASASTTRTSIPKPPATSRDSRPSSGGDSSASVTEMSLEEALRELEIERRHSKNAEVMLREEITKADKDKSEERKRYVELQFRAEADRKASEDAQKKLEMAASKVAYYEELSKKNEREIQKYEGSIRELDHEREQLHQGIKANEREAALAMERIADAEARAEAMDLAAGERERILLELQKERQIADELKGLHARGEAKMKEQARVIAELKHNLDGRNRNATELETQLKDEKAKAVHHKQRHEQLESEFTEQHKKIETLTTTIEGQRTSDLSREKDLSRQLQVEFERQESASRRLAEASQRQQEKFVVLERAFSGMESRFESQISLEKERYANLERELRLEKGETERLRSYAQERFGEIGELRDEITARFSDECQRADAAALKVEEDISSRHGELSQAIEDMAKGVGDESVRHLEEHRVDMEEFVEARLNGARKEYEQLHESVVSDLKTLMEAIQKLGRLKDEVKEDVSQCVRGLRELDDKVLGVQKESSQGLIKAGEDISTIGRSLRNTESSLQQFADSFDRRLRETISELRVNISEVDSNGRKNVDDGYNRVTREVCSLRHPLFSIAALFEFVSD